MGEVFSTEGWAEIHKDESTYAKAEAELNLLRRMDDITDIESENGRTLFEYLAKKIREVGSDSEDGKVARITYLPW